MTSLPPDRVAGFSLIEVLIALLVFSLGLMGLAASLVMSVRTTQGAYIRTQANFLAQSMADRMRANVPMVWAGSYNDSYVSAATPVPGSDPCASGSTSCSRAQVASRDLYQWRTQVQTLMPAQTSAVILCTQVTDPNYAPLAAEIANGAPYSGTCAITLRWTELSLNRATQGSTAVADTSAQPPQTFNWVFTP
ncbi:MAG: type IV pilus modification protein PilV [Rudaea sp.]|uniref:type IV pilus modification protein PilV n=1 Tax=unclassified Rudaea TaxID=2627037 RepID=UPI001484D073|nr:MULTISPECIES: type IV pilus modification protein PilV [unclassified Rudaea]MBN8886571.1 type IV pilus modification protein PilV [Rudaea sp.]MBR0343892.1 type IV pilus modification protein PilV [Rudaea sp.]